LFIFVYIEMQYYHYRHCLNQHLPKEDFEMVKFVVSMNWEFIF